MYDFGVACFLFCCLLPIVFALFGARVTVAFELKTGKAGIEWFCFFISPIAVVPKQKCCRSGGFDTQAARG
jgi:hypothetical protein